MICWVTILNQKLARVLKKFLVSVTVNGGIVEPIFARESIFEIAASTKPLPTTYLALTGQ
jgi:hypothetical protein